MIEEESTVPGQLGGKDDELETWWPRFRSKNLEQTFQTRIWSKLFKSLLQILGAKARPPASSCAPPRALGQTRKCVCESDAQRLHERQSLTSGILFHLCFCMWQWQVVVNPDHDGSYFSHHGQFQLAQFVIDMNGAHTPAYSSISAHRNRQIETADWIWPVFFSVL